MDMSRRNKSSTKKEPVLIPFGLTYLPMKKLAIINFEKEPDTVYRGLELQYFSGGAYGEGYRIIAYRKDGYVDVYDGMELNDVKDDSFAVAGKGLCQRKKVPIENTIFTKEAGCAHIAFEFKDKEGRPIAVNIKEGSKKKTKGINLLAPIGMSTERPSYLPLFFLYDFDFVRKHQTDVKLVIDGKTIKQDNFPVPLPKDLQWRYYSRFSPDCQIIEFANSKQGTVPECVPDDSGKALSGQVEYHFNQSTLLKIFVGESGHPLIIEFDLGFPDMRKLGHGSEHIDTFKISADKGMGYISGEYTVKRDSDDIKIELIPSGGWTPEPDSFLTKVMFGKKSIFRRWPKTYRYKQRINLATLQSDSIWERIK